MAGVNYQPLEVRLVNDCIEKVLPYPAIPPATEATTGIFPVPQVWWQVSPWCPSAQVPKHCVQEQPIVPGWRALFPWPTRQMRLEKLPNLVRNVVPSMRCRHTPTPHVHSPADLAGGHSKTGAVLPSSSSAGLMAFRACAASLPMYRVTPSPSWQSWTGAAAGGPSRFL